MPTYAQKDIQQPCTKNVGFSSPIFCALILFCYPYVFLFQCILRVGSHFSRYLLDQQLRKGSSVGRGSGGTGRISCSLNKRCFISRYTNLLGTERSLGRDKEEPRFLKPGPHPTASNHFQFPRSCRQYFMR
jgi:hypothetical protein